MNDIHSSHAVESSWLTYAHELRATQSAGQFFASGGEKPLILDWIMTDILSPDLKKAKENVADLAARVTAADEAAFLKAHPDAALQELFLKPCQELLAQGPEAADWPAIELTIAHTIKQFYCVDMQSFGERLKPLMNDVLIFVSIKEAQQELGFLIASITPALPDGDVKLITLIVEPTARGRGLEKLLAASLFRLIPKIKRIFTGIRITHREMRTLYESLGFVQDANPFQDPFHKVNNEYFTVLEYKGDRNSLLQTVSNALE